MARVVAIEQNTDELTTYIQAYRERFVYSHPTLAGASPRHTLTRCFNNEAVREHIHQAVQHSEVHFVTGTGHGSYDRFTGQNGMTVWEALTVPAEHVRGRIIHLLSCQTGAVLGLRCVQLGASAFWGYTVNFILPFSPNDSVDGDNPANLFLRMDAIIDRGILAGQGSQAIYDSVVRYFSQVYTQLMKQNHITAAGWLLDNFVHLVSPALTWGDPNATLSQ